MDPILIGRSRLRVASPRPRPRWTTTAFVGLIGVVAATGALAAREHAAPAGVSALLSTPGVTYLGQTQVPAPSASFPLEATTTRPGVFVFRPSGPMSLASQQSLFASYLQTMSSEGWTLLAKRDPTRSGWTLRWQFAERAALLSFTTSPKERLEVDVCPPQPYC